MIGERDDFSAGVKRILAHRAGHCCSKPSCRALTAGPSEEASDAVTNIGVASHITAASPGGPRFDPALTIEERRSVNNGIWLCQTHAKEIDDDTHTYSADVLRAWKGHSEDEARALLGRPISGQSLEISIQVTLHRAADDSLVVTGATNLPWGTKLFVELYYRGKSLGQAKSTVLDGLFSAPGCRNGAAPHKPGWYTVVVLAYFNGPWQQPQAVIDIVGREGTNLVGRFVEPLHPEFSESENRFHASFECVAPPLANAPEPSMSDLVRAIDLVKEAILTVDGRKSASPIREVVQEFMASPGLRMLDGWSARALPNGAILVSLSFWDGQAPSTADWTVILEPGEVRYSNLSGKYMSWLPED